MAELPDPDDVPTRRGKAFAAKLVAYCQSIKPRPGLGITVSEDGSGTVISTSGAAANAAGGVKEVVTGAVNGVASHLTVLTDGTGWIAV